MTRRSATARLLVPVGAADHILGQESAPVTLLEYGDYECPTCGQAYPVVKELLDRLGPKLKFVFRAFPLKTVHPDAEQAAEAAEAAGSQGKYWEMHGVLFENQDALDDRSLIGYATAIGLDESQFISELVEHTHADRVYEQFMGGIRSGVNGTPTFFINGYRHDDSFGLGTLLEVIEGEVMDVTGRA